MDYDLAFLAEDGSVLKIRKSEDFFFNNYLSVLQDVVTKTEREAFLSRDTLRTRCRLWRTAGKAIPTVTIFARTVCDVETRNFLWDIENFCTFKQGHKVDFVLSSEPKDDAVTFSLGVNKEDKIEVSMKPSNENLKFLNFQSLITDSNGSNTDCGYHEIWPVEIGKDNKFTLPFTKTYLIDNKHLYLKNDVFSLYCECSLCYGFLFSRIEKIYSGINPFSITNPIFHKPCMTNAIAEQLDSMSDLKEDFGRLYDEGLHSDMKLRTATETFHTHKNILSIRSPVFRKMFATDMKENIQECVDIPDLDDDTVRRMLLYVYTNALEDLQWESALRLYAAADKYEIVALKSKCSCFLKRNLCPSNLYDALVLADRHADGELKAAAQDYALKHEENVFNSEEWKAFVQSYSTLAAATMLLKWNKK
ncbi:hypothetical protein NPIL_350791 [Nephila pilipes]|uniref:BTB domain-containing protein n=1 Tax=Nephila pilipes TaxID=299642 RepID=A0A8X6QCU9_NEPPI|nr:hypothetical protein NPIL_350791 [Nephila pilipes]